MGCLLPPRAGLAAAPGPALTKPCKETGFSL
jgi:hypothetical protein